MEKFEYLTIKNVKDNLQLNELGSIGWELISVFKIWEENKEVYYIFKRKI